MNVYNSLTKVKEVTDQEKKMWYKQHRLMGSLGLKVLLTI